MAGANLAAGLPHRRAKARLAQAGIAGPAAAKITEMAIAAGQEILGRQPPHGRVVDVDHRRLQPIEHAGRIHHRLAEPEHRAGDLRVIQVGDDPVRVPFLQGPENCPRGRGTMKEPPSLGTGVLADSQKHLPMERRILAHQQGNPSGSNHGWPFARLLNREPGPPLSSSDQVLQVLPQRLAMVAQAGKIFQPEAAIITERLDLGQNGRIVQLRAE